MYVLHVRPLSDRQHPEPRSVISPFLKEKVASINLYRHTLCSKLFMVCRCRMNKATEPLCSPHQIYSIVPPAQSGICLTPEGDSTEDGWGRGGRGGGGRGEKRAKGQAEHVRSEKVKTFWLVIIFKAEYHRFL